MLVPSIHRILVLFLVLTLSPRPVQTVGSNKFEDDSQEEVEEPASATSTFTHTQLYVDCSHFKVIDDNLFNAFTSSDYLKMSDLLKILEGYEPETVGGLKISEGFIGEESLVALANKDVGIGFFPQLKLLDLSYDRIQADAFINAQHVHYQTVTRYITKLLAQPYFRFLDITGNDAASIDMKPFFNALSDEHLIKIIWIPENWLKAYRWMNVSCDVDRLEAENSCKKDKLKKLTELGQKIEKCHRDYYEIKQCTELSESGVSCDRDDYGINWNYHLVPIDSVNETREVSWGAIKAEIEDTAIPQLHMFLNCIATLEGTEQSTQETKQNLAELLCARMVDGIADDVGYSLGTKIFLHLIETAEEASGFKEYYEARIQEAGNFKKAFMLYQKSADKGCEAANAALLSIEEEALW